MTCFKNLKYVFGVSLKSAGLFLFGFSSLHLVKDASIAICDGLEGVSCFLCDFPIRSDLFHGLNQERFSNLAFWFSFGVFALVNGDILATDNF